MAMSAEQIIEIYKNGLDDLVNVNSLFSIAVFLGLSFATPGQRSLESRPKCDAEPHKAKLLVVLEVVSFSFFLLSSLVAKSLKVNLQIYGQENFCPKGGLRFLKWLFLCLSVYASFLGCFFLMLSMIYLIQIRLGRLSCKSPYSGGAILSMIGIVSIGMLIYMPLVVAALHKQPPNPPEKEGIRAEPSS
ncbi:hypothetical protein LOK49_LG15G00960 [Camellia lanceoleosa]|uniref:Uncharacterized protein n=1 Tax=Camellia lanceoleosa TaxID=1840588 RepID=A0ACC0F3K0_9ERIC|nr:hypothetical protein LOK49_LG15G00960 [Camellia lanceoleosa]